MRKTKIIATIGPRSRSPDVLARLFRAGMDCARLNFSHGTLEEHARVIATLRELSRIHQRPLAILQDLGGAKMRLGRVEEHQRLQPDDSVTLVAQDHSTDPEVLPFPHPEVLAALKKGDQVFIADGSICVEVVERVEAGVRAVVTRGGMVSSFRGVNIPGVELSPTALTERAKRSIRFGIEHDVDWLAVSFVRGGRDIEEVRSYVEEQGGSMPIMAKLERAEALGNLDSILETADAVMVARGDLGIETPMARVPLVQKHVVQRAKELGVLSVIATQMLNSMVLAPMPTRAEVSDVSNAVLDGCDAVLLSDETAIGHHPVETVEFADSIIRESEEVYPFFPDLAPRDRTQSIANAAATLMRGLGSHVIVVTSTGRAAFEVARYRPAQRILVLAHDEPMVRRLCLGWGLIPLGTIPAERDIPRLVAMIVDRALDSGLVTKQDVLTIVHGFLTGVAGTTNTVQVLYLRDYLARREAGLAR